MSKRYCRNVGESVVKSVYYSYFTTHKPVNVDTLTLYSILW